MECKPITTKKRLSKTVSHTAEFEIDQPVQAVFPLFSPEGERLWAPGWDYENFMGTNQLQEDDIFLTRAHDHAANEAIWIVKRYEPEAHRVQYYKIEPGEKVGIIEVTCVRSGPRSSKVRVTYRYTGLSESGNRFVARFTKKDYQAFIEDWKRLIEAYFAKRARESIPASG
jgi:hypothetical protein